MSRRIVLLGLASLLIITPAAASASVDVELGPAVQARAGDLGARELEAQRQALAEDVARATARKGSPYAHVHLVIEDIQPNRPTDAELARSASLSKGGSIGVGGAAIDGEATTADGVRLPIRYRFFQPDLRTETNFTTWGDAQEAFDDVARAIASGHPPDQRGAWPPPRAPETPTGTRIPPP